MAKYFFLFSFFLLAFKTKINSQTRQNFSIPKTQVFYPTNPVPLNPEKEVEMPHPGGNFDKQQLKKIKRANPWIKNRITGQNLRKEGVDQEIPVPIKQRAFNLIGPYITAVDTNFPVTGGTPLDNTMAISDGNMLITAFNSKIYAHDLNADTALFRPNSNINTLTFSQFALKDSTSTISPFDPKLLYDPINDRFIITFLSGFTKNDSKIVIAFSSTNNPVDPWYVYTLPGNPRNGNDWTDYPAISISEKDVFLTINLIIEGVSWQSGFNGTIIWQMPLKEGYAGVETLPSVMWDDIKFNGRYIRNLNPVQSAMEPKGKDMYFISNRNFDLQNDTIFLVHVSDSAGSAAALSIKVGKLDVSYGVPPNGLQEDTDLNDPATGLQTNDARWLGAYKANDKIQFVGNTIDTTIGRAGIYHGIIEGVGSDNLSFKGHIISDPNLDFGYPNIAFTGTDACEMQSIIGFDHTSITHYAGMSCIYYSNARAYSPVLRLKAGFNYVDNFQDNDPYERWGDYLGFQRKFNEPGKVWTAGFFALPTRKSSVYVAELLSPDTNFLKLTSNSLGNTNNFCEKTIVVDAENGIEPYSYYANSKEFTNSILFNACSDSALTIQVKDQNACTQYLTIKGSEILPTANLYPNPSRNFMVLSFYTSEKETIYLDMYDISGKLISQNYMLSSIAGHNKLRFSIENLSSGTYRLIARNAANIVLEQTFLKVD